MPEISNVCEAATAVVNEPAAQNVLKLHCKKIDRRTLEVFIQSDVIEQWMQEHNLPGTATSSEAYPLFARADCYLNESAYNGQALQLALAGHMAYGANSWGRVLRAAQYSAELLKIVGLREGKTLTIRVVEYTWTRERVSTFAENIRTAAESLYREEICPIETRVRIAAVTEGNRLF